MNTSSHAPVEDSRPTGDVVANGWLASQSMFGSLDEHRAQRAFGASVATIVLHGVFLLIALMVLTYHATNSADVPEQPITHLVYLQEPGPGGGGGGNPAPAPPKPLEIPKPKPVQAVPVTPPPPVPVAPPPPPTLTAPVMTPSAEIVQASGTSGVSLTPYGGGGRGRGVGSGTGSGVGPGEGGGFGGNAYKPGAGISFPTVVREVKPQYTPEAMRLKIQGTVELEAVVQANGTVGDIRVVKSLDRTHGLDDEARKAARNWIFNPAKDREGKAVPVIVTLQLDFRIH
jgi:TonB family protein